MPGYRGGLGGSLWGIGASIGAGIDPEPARRRNRRGRPIIGEEQPGMSLFQRAHAIVQAKANKALDAAEKPDEMLDLSYEQMLDQITQVRRGLVDIAASRKQIELQEQQLQHSVAHLQDQAKAALAQGNEELAREALSRKAAAQAQIDAMEPQHQQLTEQEEKLGQTLDALQKRVNTFRTQKEVLKAQYTAAKAESSVGESAAGISQTVGDSGAELQRAQDKIANMQARAGAVDELLASGVLEDVGGDTDDIQQELDEAGTAAQVDKELAALKAEIGPGGLTGTAGADRERRELRPAAPHAAPGTRCRPWTRGPHTAGSSDTYQIRPDLRGGSHRPSPSLEGDRIGSSGLRPDADARSRSATTPKSYRRRPEAAIAD